MDDREAIKQLKYEYCYHLDAGNVDEFLPLFTEDGEIIVDTPTRHFAGQGSEKVREFITTSRDRSHKNMTHMVSNPVIEINDTTATGKWYYIKVLETQDGDVSWGQGQYADEYRVVDGTWKIAKTNPRRTNEVTFS